MVAHYEEKHISFSDVKKVILRSLPNITLVKTFVAKNSTFKNLMFTLPLSDSFIE